MTNNLYHYRAYVTSVYDGDSFTLEVDMGFGITNKLRVRLYGLDTPEVRRAKGRSEAHVIQGKEIRDLVRRLILRKHIIVKTFQNKKYDARKGKYGRYLVHVWYEDSYGNWHHLNDVLSVLDGVRVMDDGGSIVT